MVNEDEVGRALARLLNGEIATPELLSVVTGMTVDEVVARADDSAVSPGGYDDEALTADERIALAREYAGSIDPEVQAFLAEHAHRRQ
jgi:hypothetical protein